MAVATQSPDLFELSYEDTKITYAPDVFGGSPRLHYAGPLGQHSFEGDQIRAMSGARGQEISVTLDTVSRFNAFKLTLFVPDMELDDDAGELSFRTIGISSTHRRGSDGRHAARPAASEPLELDGLARTVVRFPVRDRVLL